MKIWTKAEPEALQGFAGAVVTIGNFDGLHLGHQALLACSASQPGPRVVLTFDPHPLQVLYPQKGLKRLFPREDLFEQLGHFGVDLLWVIPFTRDFAKFSADEFLQRFLELPFQPRHLIAGYDFGFGRDRAGSLASLERWSDQHECALHTVPPLTLEGAPVSSRRIRELIEQGEVAAAQRLLGRPFYLRGQVVHGAGRGAQIGVPTLNQSVINETRPQLGVYITRARMGQKAYPAITNVGVTPTFGGTQVKVETHLLDAQISGRGQMLDVDFLQRLRAEMKFSGPAELLAQIQKDIDQARQFHAKAPF